jgi:hypothetical protein
MKARTSALLAAAALLFAAGSATADDHDELMTCEMEFNLSGWSFIYKTAKGTGRVECDDGSEANVRLRVRGGGLTVGKSEVLYGTGTFSGVKSIDEIYGGYAAAHASGGAVKSGEAIAMTKGEVSLALSGTGRGWSVDLSFTNFKILRP